MGAITEPSTNPITGESSDPKRKLSLVQERKLHAATHAFNLDSDKNVLLYLNVVLAQCGLPYTDPGENCPLYTRDNGVVALSIARGSIMNPHNRTFVMQGYPYGTRPRVMMLYFCTEAMRNKKQELYLGDTISEWMRMGLGITPITGKKGTIRPLQEQITRLFASNMRFYITSPGRTPGETKMSMINGVPFLSKFDIWFPTGIHEVGKWDGAVTLNDEIFERLKAGCMPVRQVDILALQNSPMALDIYTWLAYTNFAMKQQRSRPLTWDKLKYQFGPEYDRLRKFREKFLEQLGEVHKVYPAARFEIDPKTGLTIIKSPTPVARKNYA
jgi:hypothetical protein